MSCRAGAESTCFAGGRQRERFYIHHEQFPAAGDWELKKDAAGKAIGGLHAEVYQQLDTLINANYKNTFGAPSVG